MSSLATFTKQDHFTDINKMIPNLQARSFTGSRGFAKHVAEILARCRRGASSLLRITCEGQQTICEPQRCDLLLRQLETEYERTASHPFQAICERAM